MTAAMPIAEAASGRAMLLVETRRAMDLLGGLLEPKSVLAPHTAGSVSGARAEVERVLERSEMTVALVGERSSNALLDAFLGETLFGDADTSGVGPLIVLKRAERAGYRALMRDGTSEDFDVVVPDREAELAKRIEELERERKSIEADAFAGLERLRDEPASTPAAIVTARGAAFALWLVALWTTIRDFFARMVRSRFPAKDDPASLAEESERLKEVGRRAQVQAEIDRLKGERAAAGVERRAALVARLRALVDPKGRAPQISELRISYPAGGMTDAMTLIDARGPLAATGSERETAWNMVRKEVDACLLVVERSKPDDVATSTLELSKELCTLGPHLMVATAEARAEHTRSIVAALPIDAGRVLYVLPPLSSASVAGLLVNERTLMAGVRSMAALRLARASVEEAMERDEEPDRQAIDRLKAHGIPDKAAFAAESQKRVAGACAGRAVRILQGTVSALEGELAMVREDAKRALHATKTLDELKAAVQTTGGSLRFVRERLEAQVQALVDEAVAELAPTLLRDFDRRRNAVIQSAAQKPPALPSWPAAPRAEAPVAALVAHATLAAAEALRADLGWTDSFLRSFEKVKQRTMSHLAQQLERVAREAHAEVLGAEPKMAQALSQALGTWIEMVYDRFVFWLEEVVTAESEARAAKRLERQKHWVAQRESLIDCERRLGALSRTVATTSQELAASLSRGNGASIMEELHVSVVALAPEPDGLRGVVSGVKVAPARAAKPAAKPGPAPARLATAPAAKSPARPPPPPSRPAAPAKPGPKPPKPPPTSKSN